MAAADWARPRTVTSSSGEEARLRRDARAMLDGALAAVEPTALVEEELRARPLETGDRGRVVVLAVGKAAIGMAEGARRVLGGRIGEGLVLVPDWSGGHAPAGFEVYRGGHPLPDSDGVEGARAIGDAARRADASDRLLVLISGGGSALLTLPAGDVSLADVREVSRMLLRSGAPIGELNAVRKHLDTLKGGGLARVATPTPVRALILSDVVGDPLDVIASGPLSPDPTTFGDAIEVLERRGLWASAPERVCRHLRLGRGGRLPETPKPVDRLFSSVETRVVGNAARAVAGASATARELGYHVRIHSVGVTGEASVVGRELAGLGMEIRRLSSPLAMPVALLAAGETTVTLLGDGKGGRNQEVALGAALALEGVPGVLVMAAGTDGVDGPSDAAGAMATGSTLDRARGTLLDAEDSLRRNDAYPFFAVLDDLVNTGPTGNNVMDLMVVLVAT